MTLLTDAKGDLIEHHEILEMEGVRYLLEPIQYVSSDKQLDKIDATTEKP